MTVHVTANEAAGADDVQTKPLDLAKLAAILAKALEQPGLARAM